MITMVLVGDCTVQHGIIATLQALTVLTDCMANRVGPILQKLEHALARLTPDVGDPTEVPY